MLRRFRQHDQRLVTDLSGIWDFAFLGAPRQRIVSVFGHTLVSQKACFRVGISVASCGYAHQRTRIFLTATWVLPRSW